MTSFAVTWDYRCPFARNAHEHVLAGLGDGAPWDVTFVPFSLGQVHAEDSQDPIWDRPEEDSGLLALQVGAHVRSASPETFLAVHRALFSARHDHGLDLRDRAVLAKVLVDHGLDDGATFAAIDDGSVLAQVRAEHEAAASDHSVWGVPTFIHQGHAAFVRVMDRPDGDGGHARATVERVLALLADAPAINEFKHTSLPS